MNWLAGDAKIWQFLRRFEPLNKKNEKKKEFLQKNTKPVQWDWLIFSWDSNPQLFKFWTT